MKKFWMPLYIGEYLADTAHLTPTEHGAYVLLMIHYWMKEGLPEDDDAIRRITRMSTRQWSQSRDVIKGLFNNNWRHVRLDEELRKATEKSKVNSANARRSHTNRNRSAPEFEQRSHAESESQLESQPQSQSRADEQQQEQRDRHFDSAATPAAEDDRVQEQLGGSLEVRELADRVSVLVGRERTYEAVQTAARWLDNGWQSDLIDLAVRQVMAKRSGKPPRTLKYFDEAITEAHAQFAPHLLGVPPGCCLTRTPVVDILKQVAQGGSPESEHHFTMSVKV